MSRRRPLPEVRRLTTDQLRQQIAQIERRLTVVERSGTGSELRRPDSRHTGQDKHDVLRRD